MPQVANSVGVQEKSKVWAITALSLAIGAHVGLADFAEASCPPSLAWSRSYNSLANGGDVALAVAVDTNMNLIVVGFEDRSDLSERFNWLIRKYDPMGNLLWSRDYTSSGERTDVASAVAVDGSGNVVVAGYEDLGAVPGLQRSNWLIRKYDSTGNLLWSRTYTSPAPEYAIDLAFGVAVDPSDNVVVVGREDQSDLGQSVDWLIRKYDSVGNLLWSKTYNKATVNGADVAYGVAVDGTGNVLVVGFESGGGGAWLIRKYDSNGNLLWSHNGPAVVDGVAYAVAAGSSGNAVVVGHQNNDWLVRKYDNLGNLLWSRTYNSPANNADIAYGVAIDSSEGVWVVGAENQSSSLGGNWLIRKYDSAGNLLWSQTYNSPANNRDVARGAAVDASGSAVVVGWERRDDLLQAENWLIRKYLQPACLTTAIAVNPPPVTVGQWFTVALTVSNTGVASATGVLPFLEINSGGSLVAYQGGPSPAGPVTIARGGSQSFTWTYSVSGAGMVSFIGTASGTDAGSGMAVSAAATASMTLQAAPAPPGQIGVSSTSGRLPVNFANGEALLIRLNPAEAGRLRVQVYNLLWEEVARLYDGPVSPGPMEIRWKGRNRRGSFVAAGMYLVKLELPGKKPAIKRIVVGN